MPFGNSYPVIERDSRNINEVDVAPIILSQGDSSGRIIRYALWDGQDAMSGTGLSARFCIDQDEGLYAAMTAVAGASTATFQVAVPMGGVEAGWHAGCIRVSDSGGRVINTRLFKVYVEKSAIGSSAEQITAYADIIAGAEDATTAANAAATAANNAAASAIAASENRLTATLDGTGATPDTASDAWTGPLIGATVDGLSTQDGTPTPTVPVAIKSVEGAAAAIGSRNLMPRLVPGTYNKSGVTAVVDSDGLITISGTSTAASRIELTIDAPITLPSQSIYLHIRNTIISSDIVLAFDPNNHYLSFNTANRIYKFDSMSGEQVTKITLAFSSGHAFNGTIQPSLELTGDVTEFEQSWNVKTSLLPSTAEPLRSLPDGTHDELSVARDGTVSVVRRVGSVTVDGSSVSVENVWTAASYPLFGVTIPASKASTSSSARSDRFTATDSSQIWNGGSSYAGKFAINAETTRNLRLRLADSSITTVAAANTWFASNPSTFFYPLATPTTETLPSVTMPTVPSRNLTAWTDATDADGAAIAAPWEMVYERDVTYVIEQLEQAIADI